MEKETKNEVLDAIKKRGEISKPYFSISKMLEENGMEDYVNVCFNRIEEHIDGNHVVFDIFENYDLLVDYIGIHRCEYILEGYIPMEKLEKYQKYLYSLNELARAQNAQINFMRSHSDEIIKKLLKDRSAFPADTTDEVYDKICQLLRAELSARKPMNMTYQNLKKKVEKAVLYVRNWRIIMIVRKAMRCENAG